MSDTSSIGASRSGISIGMIMNIEVETNAELGFDSMRNKVVGLL